MRCSFCFTKSLSTLAACRKLCVNAQSKDPISSYGFYLRKEKFENEEKFRLLEGPPHDQRLDTVRSVTPQTLSRWCYDPTQKITIGYPQLEWITKSQIEVNKFPESTNECLNKIDHIKARNDMKRILRECYVFDTKDYERSIKVPLDPTDRWNPRMMKKFLDYPNEARLMKNVFTSAISAMSKQFPLTR